MYTVPIPLPGRVAAIYSALLSAPQERCLAPANAPAAARTHPGRVRETNEDAVLLLGVRAADGREAMAAVVCDGVGGRPRGREAAALAAASIFGVLTAEPVLPPEARLREAFLSAHRALRQAFSGNSGATVVCCYEESLGDNRVRWLGWIGDSRAYAVHEGQLRRLTTDDSNLEQGLRTEIAPDDGPAPDGPAPDGPAPDGPAREHSSLLLQALGLSEEISPHLQAISDPLERLVLMTDGASGLAPAASQWLVGLPSSPEALAQRWVEASLWQGGGDNSTVVVWDQGPHLLPLNPEEQGLVAWVNETPTCWIFKAVRAREPGLPAQQDSHRSVSTSDEMQNVGKPKNAGKPQNVRKSQNPNRSAQYDRYDRSDSFSGGQGRGRR